MRLQDELVALHAVADASTRKYILGQVPRLPVHFDAGELADLLDRALADGDREIAARAAVAWDRAGPRLIAYAYGLDPGRMGLWSAVALKMQGGSEGQTPEGPAPDAASQRAGLANVLAPCAAPLTALAARAGAHGDMARQVLGLLPIAGSEEALVEAAHDPARAASAMLALARRNAKLAAATARDARRLPARLRAVAAGTIGDKAGLALALEAARSGDAGAWWAAAEALPDLAGEAWAEVAHALMTRQSGWAPVVLADALGQLGPPAAKEALELLDELLKKGTHDLVRIMAVRSMGAYPGELAPRRALKCLERGSPLLQAAAIEALVRLDHRAPELPGLLAQRTGAGPLKLRGTAILGLMTFDRKAALQRALELVNDASPAARIEGGYALGYLKGKTGLSLLGVLARKDQFVPSALQAEKALAHFPEGQVAPLLIELLSHREPAVALGALRVLSHFPGESQAGVLPAIEALEKKSSPAAARAVLRECGLLGPAVPGLTDYLARPRTDPELALGALEGLVRAGDVPAELAKGAASGAAPEQAVTGALAQLVSGDAVGAATLATYLSADRFHPAALFAVRDLAAIAGEAGRGGRHARLQRLVMARRTARTQPVTSAVKRPSLAIPRPETAAPPPPAPNPQPPPSLVDDPLIRTLPETAGAAEKLAGVLARATARPRDWAREVTYLHGPTSLLERLAPYKALLPAVAIVLAVVGFFAFETARNALYPEESPVAKRDAVLGKVGTAVEVSGKVTEVQPERHTFQMQTLKNVAVSVWLPTADLKPLKPNAPITVKGVIKDVRSDRITLHGLGFTP